MVQHLVQSMSHLDWPSSDMQTQDGMELSVQVIAEFTPIKMTSGGQLS
jgi:hypothetical protein